MAFKWQDHPSWLRRSGWNPNQVLLVHISPSSCDPGCDKRPVMEENWLWSPGNQLTIVHFRDPGNVETLPGSKCPFFRYRIHLHLSCQCSSPRCWVSHGHGGVRHGKNQFSDGSRSRCTCGAGPIRAGGGWGGGQVRGTPGDHHGDGLIRGKPAKYGDKIWW